MQREYNTHEQKRHAKCENSILSGLLMYVSEGSGGEVGAASELTPRTKNQTSVAEADETVFLSRTDPKLTLGIFTKEG
jgi:hypothetical protein